MGVFLQTIHHHLLHALRSLEYNQHPIDTEPDTGFPVTTYQQYPG